MTISELAYILYKIDWMRRISNDRIKDFVKTYYDDCKITNDFSVSITEALSEFGFDGEIFCCYDEFLDAEYQDRNYMKTLLNDAQYTEYLEEITKTQPNEQ